MQCITFSLKILLGRGCSGRQKVSNNLVKYFTYSDTVKSKLKFNLIDKYIAFLETSLNYFCLVYCHSNEIYLAVVGRWCFKFLPWPLQGPPCSFVVCASQLVWILVSLNLNRVPEVFSLTLPQFIFSIPVHDSYQI